MTSTDNTSKPLKTVDNILAILAWKGKYTDAGQEVVNAGEVKQAKAELYQLMLSLVPKEREWDKSEPYDNPDIAQGRNEAISDMKEKLSEHFNGEERDE